MKNILILILLLLSSIYSYARTLTITPGGIGVHTLRPNPTELRDLMPRKVDSTGHVVITPGVGAIYKWRAQELGAVLISDSFSNPALATIYGREWQFDWPDLSWGIVGGVYIRKSILGCHAYNYKTLCVKSANDLPVRVNIGGGSSKTDIAPILGLQLNYSPRISNNYALDINLVSAFYISLLTVGIKFNWDRANK